MMTEYHCHILPGIDDGSKSPEMSLEMVAMMQQQGVERIVATPHFYAHREESVESYLQKRQEAFEKIKGQTAVTNIRLGAEVAIEHGISELPGIEKLAIEGTNLILLELPYRPYEKWMSEEIYNFYAEFKLRVILAHVHRYLEYYSKDELEGIFDTRHSYLQINNEAFESWRERRLVKRLINEERRLVFGSDAHDIKTRRPNWDVNKKKCPSEVLEFSNGVLDRYML